MHELHSGPVISDLNANAGRKPHRPRAKLGDFCTDVFLNAGAEILTISIARFQTKLALHLSTAFSSSKHVFCTK